MFFGPDGILLGKHRKLKPTGSERLILGEGDGSTLPIFGKEDILLADLDLRDIAYSQFDFDVVGHYS